MRIRRLALLAIVVFLGFFSRRWPIGLFVWDKSLGDIAYAAAAYLLLLLLLPRRSPAVLALFAMLFCLAIECFKFTGLPQQWAASPISRVVFGTTFSWHNLACYAIAIAAILAIERSPTASR
ncbi:MAG: DUF2809 domain-containing protein [Tepidisphaeraceae bacterium]|jgi:hypothetical protein